MNSQMMVHTFLSNKFSARTSSATSVIRISSEARQEFGGFSFTFSAFSFFKNPYGYKNFLKTFASIFVFTIIFLAPESSNSQSRDSLVLEGFINSDRTLSPGIYVIRHNVKIAEGATLTIPA